MAIRMKKKKKGVKKIVKSNSTKIKAKNLTKPPSQDTFNIPNTDYIEAIGKRKVAVARVRIYPGEGDFVVNDTLVGKYFSNVLNAPKIYNLPFELTSTKGKFAVTVKVSGSGIRSQLDAVTHGLSRALVNYDPELKVFLKKADLITRDDRMKETRKVGMGGKARRKRQSPKR